MSDRLRILVIGAHPADIFDQSGGTMAHHVQRGDWVGCIVLTHGARIHDKVISDEMFHREQVPAGAELENLMHARAQVKGEEVRQACRVLGVEDLYFFDVDDSVLTVDEPLIRRLASAIRKLRPNLLITHFPKEEGGISSPHAVTGRMVMYARNLANSVDGEDETPPHTTAQVFYFGAGAAPPRVGLWDSEGGFTCDVVIDITDVIDRKLAALNTLDSQGYAGDYARKRIETNDGAFGGRVGVAYGEPFISLKASAHYYLPLSSIDLAVSKMSDHERLAQRSYRTPATLPERPHDNAPAHHDLSGRA